MNFRTPGQEGKLGIDIMSNDELFALLSFEGELESVEILSQEDAGNGATFIRGRLHYPDVVMDVPFVHFVGKDWVFTPQDWQGALPQCVGEIGNVEWRVNDTETPGVMFLGVPMLAPWTPDPVEPEDARHVVGRMVREARERRGLSQRELAKRAGLQYSHIARIESGRYNLTIDTLERVCKELGLEIELVGTEDTK